jgi:hypothetical protein
LSVRAIGVLVRREIADAGGHAREKDVLARIAAAERIDIGRVEQAIADERRFGRVVRRVKGRTPILVVPPAEQGVE